MQEYPLIIGNPNSERNLMDIIKLYVSTEKQKGYFLTAVSVDNKSRTCSLYISII
jgi:hypothetical protein